MARVFKTVGILLALTFVLVAYNGLRHLVYWGPAEDVTIVSDGATLACTYLVPAGAGPYPAVLELLGSGPETRSGPSYRTNANNMLRHGFAVLICDKRGSGASTGEFETTTFADFVADAAASLRYLAGRSDIESDHIGLFTNSESGWYSAQVAAETGQVAFIINRVGPPLSWLETVLWEARNEFLDAGAAESDLPRLLAATERRWRFYIDVFKGAQPPDGPERESINAELDRLRDSIPNAGELLPATAMPFDAAWYRSFAIDADYVPANYLRQIDIPLLYIFGGMDVNVPTDRSVGFLNQFEAEYASTIDVVVYPELGHAMATWRGLLHAGYPPDYLEYVGEWAQRQVRQ
jgi:pimeloyl-ACP methyl ester carboxylesterase